MGPLVTGRGADGCFLLGQWGGEGLQWGQVGSQEDAGHFPLKASHRLLFFFFSGGFAGSVGKSASWSREEVSPGQRGRPLNPRDPSRL